MGVRLAERHNMGIPAFFSVNPDYIEYLRDESRLTGRADSISFPADEAEVRQILAALSAEKSPVTVQGSRTGIVGGAVPQGGHILNLARMNRLLGLRYDSAGKRYLLRVQPGVPLSRIGELLAGAEPAALNWDPESLETFETLRSERRYFFPPDPTESSASLGGMAASDASGARSFLYGSTRTYIESVHLLLPDGSPFSLRRGVEKAQGLRFRLSSEEGRVIEAALPSYRWPEAKNAAGLYSRPNMDLIDLLIGSEGTLGVLTELELSLLPLPPAVSALMGFFSESKAALRFVQAIRGRPRFFPQEAAVDATSRPAAIEFFDGKSLEFLRQCKLNNPAFSELPEVPEGRAAAVYVELHGEDGQEVERRILALGEELRKAGGREEDTWLAEQPKPLARLKEFRHALPEALNLLVDQRRKSEPGLTKLGTDLAVPDDFLSDMLELYRRDLEESRLQYAMFGHIGDNHIHVNVLPRSLEEYRLGGQLHRRWARRAVTAGGTVSAEHGIGKLKVELLRLMYGREGLEQIHRVIEAFNPGFCLNRGNVIGYP
jgi:D-lactate dehydrogenase (cytochrome)